MSVEGKDITGRGEALDVIIALGQRNIYSPRSFTTASCEWDRGISQVEIYL